VNSGGVSGRRRYWQCAVQPKSDGASGKLRQTKGMRRTASITGFVALALATSVVALTSAEGSSSERAAAESKAMPILLRCPRASDRPGRYHATADQVIAVARRFNSREVTHYQGRAERRTRVNTPVQALVMELSDDSIDVPGRRALAVRAKKRCGKLGLATSAVTFSESLSPVCCLTFTLFVARGSRAWIVFEA
jgi:hypothetical protein